MTETTDIKQIITNNKPLFVSSLLTIAFASTIYSIRKSTSNAKDFGLSTLMSHKIYQNNPQYASYIWATRAFLYSTSIVGIGTVAIGFAGFNYLGANSVEEFNMKFKSLLHTNFPKLRVELNQEAEDKAIEEFRKEFSLEGDYSEPKGSKFITEKIRSKLGALVTK